MTGRLAAVGVLVLVLGCSPGDGGASARWVSFESGPPPAELKRAEVLYNSYCLSCHGRQGRGEGLGPPLLDSLFLRPSVTDDDALRAITTGTNQRAYSFGAMPAVSILSPPEAVQVIAYVRWLQQRAWPDGVAGTN
jgi:mono/diheme cytochrome c family protein